MERIRRFAFALAAWSVSAMAEPLLVHAPSEVAVTVAPGSAASVPVSVAIHDAGSRTHFVWTVDRAEGTVPRAWISASPATGFASATSVVSVLMRVAVPSDATPGTYVSQVWSKAMAAHGFADPGDGLRIVVRVPSRCAGKPVLQIEEFGPVVLWPPDHRLDAVVVRGQVLQPEGCTLAGAGYGIEDEYGLFSATGALVLGDDGAFVVSLPVQASRDGRDRDGRHYRITLYAENELGIATSPVLEAVVPHDRR